jgi:hypothetical protein
MCLLLRPVTRLRHNLKLFDFNCDRIITITSDSVKLYCCSIAEKGTSSDQAKAMMSECSAHDNFIFNLTIYWYYSIMLAISKTSPSLHQTPHSSGVYLFYGASRSVPIYIGKSIDLQKRIRSNFSQAKSNKKRKVS